MSPQDKSDDQQRCCQEPQRKHEQPDIGDDTSSGAGASGEGAKSALDAMLKRRQMGIHPPAESGAAQPAHPPGHRKPGE